MRAINDAAMILLLVVFLVAVGLAVREHRRALDQAYRARIAEGCAK